MSSSSRKIIAREGTIQPIVIPLDKYIAGDENILKTPIIHPISLE